MRLVSPEQLSAWEAAIPQELATYISELLYEHAMLQFRLQRIRDTLTHIKLWREGAEVHYFPDAALSEALKAVEGK